MFIRSANDYTDADYMTQHTASSPFTKGIATQYIGHDHALTHRSTKLYPLSNRNVSLMLHCMALLQLIGQSRYM
jgi:hypothetical protein